MVEGVAGGFNMGECWWRIRGWSSVFREPGAELGVGVKSPTLMRRLRHDMDFLVGKPLPERNHPLTALNLCIFICNLVLTNQSSRQGYRIYTTIITDHLPIDA